MQTAYNKENAYAGFFIRLAAFLLDMVIVNVLLLLIKLPVWLIRLALGGDSSLFAPVLFSYDIFDILYYLLTVGYFILATYFSGTTLGKYLMKIKVVSTDGKPLTFLSVLIRETVGRYLSAIILYIGYMIAGWDSEKQGLHDRIADTYVVYRDMSIETAQKQQKGLSEQTVAGVYEKKTADTERCGQ